MTRRQVAGWSHWRTWRLQSGQKLRVGWCEGGDAGAMLDARVVAGWPNGAARTVSLTIPDTNIRVSLVDPRHGPRAWEGDTLLDEEPGSSSASTSLARTILIAAGFDAIASATYFASYHIDAFYLLFASLLLLACWLLMRRSLFGAGFVGLLIVWLELASYAIVAALGGFSAIGPLLRLSIAVLGTRQLLALLLRRRHERAAFPGLPDPGRFGNQPSETASALIDRDNPFAS